MGFFLRKAREFGFETEGVEPSPSLSKIARENWGLNIHTAFLEEANLPKEHYDVITLIDVFEHVTQPKKMLRTVFDLLKTDGIVVIKVPNANYNYLKMKLAQRLGKAHKMDIWDCYEHVVHYNTRTFSKMVESCGFKIKKCIIPIPIHTPVWAHLVGFYYQYPSPFILDWKRILLRNLFYTIGKIEHYLTGNPHFAPDLMFFLEKKESNVSQ
ncbi:MAG: class I SAM-dependent methyltransferase [Bacteroidia bacterium]|nr:class I SAM-dependent methyltransferase [Bacteroidia bacterium]